MNMEKRPLIKALLEYTNEKTARFHMPGHRNEDGIPSLKLLQEQLYTFDVTEIEGTDHLHYPEDSIRLSQILLAEAMGAHESYYCVNGTTAANYAMLFGLLKPGDEVLMGRSSHQSIFNAISMRGLKARFLVPQIEEQWSLPLAPTVEEVKKTLNKYPEIKAVILTSPDYFGRVTPLQEIAAYLKSKGVYLLVDEAHGAHFPYSEKLPSSAMSMGAHASTVSFHKTLPVLTQGSVLNLSKDLSELEKRRIRHYLRVFQSSSPSYTILASMENARALLEDEGAELYVKLWDNCLKLKNTLAEIPYVKVYTGPVKYTDFTRLVISTPLSGDFLMNELRKKHRIQAEMAMGNLVVFILSPFDREKDYLRLPSAIENLIKENDKIHDKQSALQMLIYPEWEEPYQGDERILFLEQEEIPIDSALGRTSAETITPYPPGIPLLLPGERIGENEVRTLRNLFQTSNILKSTSNSPMGITVLKKQEELFE